MKAMEETSALVSTQVEGLVKVAPHENVAKIHACMKTKAGVDAYPAALPTSQSPSSARLMNTFQIIGGLVKSKMYQLE